MSSDVKSMKETAPCPACGVQLKASLGFIRCPECNAPLKETVAGQPRLRASGPLSPTQPPVGPVIQVREVSHTVSILRVLAILNFLGACVLILLFIVGTALSEAKSKDSELVFVVALFVEGILGSSLLMALASITENVMEIRKNTAALVHLEAQKDHESS